MNANREKGQTPERVELEDDQMISAMRISPIVTANCDW